MINQKVETEASFSNYAKSESVPGKKKLKKVRSIRLPRLSSIRSSTRGGKSQYENLSMVSSVGTESSNQPTPIEMSEYVSSNYMKATSSSHAKESFQITQRLFTKKTLTRMSTLKLKRSVTRKLSGRTELKRKLKSSRSIKLATVKGKKSARKLSESIHGSDGQNRKSDIQVYSTYTGNKSQRVITRRFSLKPLRILTRMPTFKSKNDSSLHKATCSSTLKDSHFPDNIDLPQEGSVSQGVLAMKVCPYTYCSLHGHRHDNLPPLKRLVSMRRRQLKTQKSKKMDGRPVTRSKQSGNARKATQKTRNVHSEDGISHFQHVKKLERDYMEQDYEIMQMSSTQKEPKPACTNDVAYRMQERDDKYIRMWHSMYKHAILSNAGKGKHELPFDGKDKEGRGQDAPSFDVGNSSSCQDYCEADQDMDDENKNVIEQVQKAFDEILLPEPEDLSSEDDFNSTGIGSDEELLEKSDGNRGEGNTSASRESRKEETLLKDDNFRSHAEEVTAKRIWTKPDQKTPKSWSNLKKLILLKRFLKALEKVRNFNLHRPRHLPSDANLEAEKVFLKHQTAEERKNAEEWMIDYALQKVISRLAPAQRRRVSLLVEAFETILPSQDADSGLHSSATVETQAYPIHPLDNSLDHSEEETDKDNASDNPMPELHNPMVFKQRCLDYPGTKTVKNIPASGAIDEDLNGKQTLASSYDNGEKISTDNDNIHIAGIKDSRSWSFSKSAEIISSCHEEAPTNEIVNEVPEDLVSTSNTEIPSSNSESTGRDFGTRNLIGANEERFSMTRSLILKGLARSLGSNLVGSEAPSDILDEPTSDRKERVEKSKLESETLKGFPTHEQSEAPKSAAVEPEIQIEKQNYTGLWYLVYKRMVSDIAENGSKSLIDESDEKESGYEGGRPRGTSVSYENTPVMNQDMHFKDHGVADPEVELQQIEAVKMVEEAIDSILPDVQDNFLDRHSLTDNTISDNSSKQSNRTERVDSECLNQTEEKTQEQEEEPAPKEGDKLNQQLPRSWSNLKKVVLLRRFIKALEKVRKFNTRGPRYLPIEPDSETEKVNLRHQDMAERKGTEEWMLDYALRQVVSKLTPARKRKVELLVEAFETVMPTMKN